MVYFNLIPSTCKRPNAFDMKYGDLLQQNQSDIFTHLFRSNYLSLSSYRFSNHFATNKVIKQTEKQAVAESERKILLRTDQKKRTGFKKT